MNKLKRGQLIVIGDIEYIVDNMIEFKEEHWVWQEYEVIPREKREDLKYTGKYWLTIEENEEKEIEYYLYLKYANTIDISKNTVEDNGEIFTLYDDGVATVKSYFGPTDVDMYEQCRYYDYISSNKEKILSVEAWVDETEYTIGYKMHNDKVQIKDEFDGEYLKRNQKTQKNAIIVCVLMFLITFGIVTFVFKSIIINKSIDKYLENTTNKYSYVTSVTNNSNNKKAKVYVSTYTTIDETIKDIINGAPEGITEVIDDDKTTEEDGYALETDTEYAYVYKHSDKKIYIQVSEKEYVNNSGTTYHSYRNRYYHSSFTNRNRSTTYYNYANSARQSSINSRTYSGGGTSGGK